MKIRIPKTPSYAKGDTISTDRMAYESNLTAPVRLTEFVCMGWPSQRYVDGLLCFGHTEVWHGERVGGEWDGSVWSGHVFFPHGLVSSAT